MSISGNDILAEPAYGRSIMHSLRACLARHRALVTILIVATLWMKALVPAGYMLGHGARVLTVEICADPQGAQIAKQIVLPADGKSGDQKGEHGEAVATCPFSALSFASIGGAEPLLLALALALILTLGFAAVHAPRPALRSHLRPPLRGPPALI